MPFTANQFRTVSGGCLLNDFETLDLFAAVSPIKILVLSLKLNSKEIGELALRHDIRKVILFGSRARGDFRRTSDIDLAVEGGDFEHFALDVNEETSTLLEFDIVNLDRDMQQELRVSIRKEGKVLYEKV